MLETGRVRPSSLGEWPRSCDGTDSCDKAGPETVCVRGFATVSVRDSLSANPTFWCSLVIKMNSQTVIGKLSVSASTYASSY